MKFPFLKEAVTNLFSKPSTYPVPQQVRPAKPNYRGRIAYDPEKCINCGKCSKVCSPGAITRIYEEVEGGTNITFEFDLTSCTFCGMCQDFCDEGAIHLTEDYHMVATDHRDLVTRGTRFKAKLPDLYCNRDKCILCGNCARNCPQGALTVDRKAKVWEVDYSKCVQCGICVSKCPAKVKALSFGKPPEEPAPAPETPAAESGSAEETA